jgi:hypothetical protein
MLTVKNAYIITGNTERCKALVYHRPLAAEARVRAGVGPHGICGVQTGTGTGLSPSSSVSPVHIIPPCFLILIRHLGDAK